MAGGSVWAATWLAHKINPSTPGPASPNPISHLILVITGQTSALGPAVWQLLSAELAGIVVAAAGILRWHHRRDRTRVDTAARHMAGRGDLKDYTRKGAAATAARLGARTAAPGVLVGRTVNTGQVLYGDYESLHVDIWGPRRGKTIARAIPAILDAPGPVVVTSNKRDVVDGTRLPRQDSGAIWVFDPQRVAGESPTWYWNVLSYVRDVETAAQLAAVFAGYSRDPAAKSDAYFEPEGQALLAWMLLAAAEARHPVTIVYRWLSDVTETEPVDILRRAGHALPAEHVQGVINMPDKQRGGIYGVARKSVGFLVNPAITCWVTYDPDRPDRPELSTDQFVRSSGDTLYLLSREGRGTAGPLVTALTVAVIEAAEDYATQSPAGRLQVPMLGVLDEAANVCRWKDLPDLYSHYGSRGIVLMTILQNWKQGVEVWGEHGMSKLWSAATIRVYGGAVADEHFLGSLVQFIGQYYPTSHSANVQYGHGQRTRSTNTDVRPENILDVADLAALPRGRAVVFASGTRPALVRIMPWQTGPYAAQVRASLKRFAPPEDLPKYELEDDPETSNGLIAAQDTAVSLTKNPRR
jgi:type IV secretory pathway TraG/TraD family ATPase VirD4